MVGGVRERGHGDDLEENHEINVTPFIDVMLVLLIIFMVAAPLVTVNVNVDLPASTAQLRERPDKPLYLTLKTDLSLSLGNDAVPRDQLATSLDQASENDKNTRIFLRADKGVDYGDFMQVINLLRDAGYTKIALVGLETVPPPIVAPAASDGATGNGAESASALAPGGVAP